ncbi:MAG: hydrogenase iron-sulfur subunit [Candidatus Bathyarchaeota archaeon]|nr:MAG: hydrogenase iron-sulfur subunit [Candidatus Bathyarchaeota archaeon]
MREVDQETRIGVFVCECGGNISDIVDVEEVVRESSTWGGVVLSKGDRYLCSKPSLEMVKESVRRHGLNSVVLACCTPKMHRKTFEMILQEEELNPALIEIVNIREQCSWIHADDPEGATFKAIDLTRGGVLKVRKAVPLTPVEVEVERSVLVVGGGISGITTALNLAENGVKVYLAEKAPSIGGHVIKYPKVFPTLDCSQCILTPKMGEIARNPGIELFTLAEVKKITGFPGNFQATISLRPRGVRVEDCIACGVCGRVCPVETINEFNEGMDLRKAVYIPFPQAVPTTYTLDLDNCSRCGKCLEVCPTKAIDLDDKEGDVKIDVGAIILATGFELHDLKEFGEYRYGKHPNVITSLQMERLLDVTGPEKGILLRRSDGGKVGKIAFVLCAGSRETERGVSYCSRVCCLYAIKQAMMAKEQDVDVWIHYIDMRTPGRRYEEFYQKAQMEGIHFVRGKITEIIPDREQLLLKAEDTLINRIVENIVDLVILCPAIVPNSTMRRLADESKVPLGEDMFVLERHPKLDPVATLREGIFACGMVSGPKDIQTAVAESEGAAAKATAFLREGVVRIQPEKVFLSNEGVCDGCGECVEICPFEALALKNGSIEVNEMLCTGCGVCLPSCHVNTLDLHGTTEDQLSSQIEGTLADSKAEIKILAFMEREIAYTAADIAGISRITYPSSIRILPLPSTGRLQMKDVLHAFACGADGIMFLEAPEEGPLGKAHLIASKRVEGYIQELENLDEAFTFRLWFSKVYVPDWRKLAHTFETFDKIIKGEGSIDLETRRRLGGYVRQRLSEKDLSESSENI